MGYRLPNGSVLHIASGFEAVKNMTALSNADPAAATLESSHGVIAGDILQVTSGWGRIDGRVVKAGTVNVNDVELLGIDSTDTVRYSPGAGAGTVREINAWTQITQVLEVESTGGEQAFATFKFLEEDDQRQLPTSRSPVSMTLRVADDASLPWYAVVDAADESGVATPLRLTLKNGNKIYYNAIVSLQRTPSLTQDQVMAVTIALSLVGRITRYAS